MICDWQKFSTMLQSNVWGIRDFRSFHQYNAKIVFTSNKRQNFQVIRNQIQLVACIVTFLNVKIWINKKWMILEPDEHTHMWWNKTLLVDILFVGLFPEMMNYYNAGMFFDKIHFFFQFSFPSKWISYKIHSFAYCEYFYSSRTSVYSVYRIPIYASVTTCP